MNADPFRILLVSLLAVWLVANPMMAQSPEEGQSSAETPTETSAVTSAPPAEPSVNRPAEIPGQLSFNFAGTNWQTVLEWFADEAELALELDQPPQGTFSFSDPTRTYSVSEALDVINLSLMKRGYSLVRRGRVLEVIDLEVENADKLISELAEIVRPEQLEERGKSDIVSCVFPLGSMTPEAAKAELALMIGPWGRVVVLDSARQVKVTETASKLIAIRDVLKSAATADANVVEIVLKNRGAEELLELARPLLGLEPGVNANDDIRISVGLFGDRIYAAGLPGKTGLLTSIIEKADQPLAAPDAGTGAEIATPVFRTHVVASADSATAFDVLQTLLAGTPDARIAIEPKTNAIVAWARPETHETIARTIAEMEGTGTQFKVLDLRRLDPAQALLTINKFFGVTETGGDGPIVDGDPATGKLWVRGTSEQIELVENLLQQLEGSDTLGALGDKVRILPYTGRAAEEALQQVEGLWPVMGRVNQIRTLTPARGGSGGSGIPERRVPRDSPQQSPRPASIPNDVDEARNHLAPAYRFVSQPGESIGESDASANAAPDQPESTSPEFVATEPAVAETATDQLPATPAQVTASSAPTRISVGGADIVVQMTPAGMLIASEDLEALDAFQSLMESLAAPSSIQSELPTIIWLKYIEAEVAAEMISSVLGGSEGTISSAVDTVTSGLGGGMLGLLGMGGGGGGDAPSSKSVLTASGSVNIVPDARLNALIIHANPVDMQMIELILEKIDRQESPEDIETVGKPLLIPVIYQNAADVAEVVKSVFGDRIAGAQGSNSSRGGGPGGGGPGGGGGPSPQDFINALRGGGSRGRAEAAKSERSKISIAVDAKSNSLVVIATPQDFAQVQQLVQTLDQNSMVTEETIVTYAPQGNVNPDVLKSALESILGTQTKSTRDSSSSSGSGPSAPASPGGGEAPDAAEIQRRIEFFRSRFGGGGGPTTPGGGFRGTGGGPPGFGGPGGGFGGFGGGGGPGGGGGGDGGGRRGGGR
jgi:type II secretory pathway component GspD/PulD (secretin)